MIMDPFAIFTQTPAQIIHSCTYKMAMYLLETYQQNDIYISESREVQ